MSGVTDVYFKGIDHVFHVTKVLVDTKIFGIPITIHWYGAIIAFGFTLAVLFGGRMAYKWKMNLDKMIDVLIWGTIFGIIGARAYYVAFNAQEFSGIGSMVRIWEGGMAIYGGLIGGLIAGAVVCKVRKLNLLNLLDIAGMSFLLGQGIGRWGNYCNQEAFGSNTELPWGMRSELTTNYLFSQQAALAEKGITVNPYAYVHPTFLYESLWCLLGFGVLYLITKRYRKFSGQTILCYGIWYGLGRTVFEGLRTDSLYLWNTSLRVSQVLSMLLVLFCTTLLIVLLRRHKKNPQPIEGVDFFRDDPTPKKQKKQKAQEEAEPPAQQAETPEPQLVTAPEQNPHAITKLPSFEEIVQEQETPGSEPAQGKEEADSNGTDY